MVVIDRQGRRNVFVVTLFTYMFLVIPFSILLFMINMIIGLNNCLNLIITITLINLIQILFIVNAWSKTIYENLNKNDTQIK